MATRSQVLAVNSVRLRWPTTRRTSPSLSSWYKLWVNLQFNLEYEGIIGERKLPKAKEIRACEEPGPICSQFCSVHDFMHLPQEICSEM